ncbi:MAG TPA: hypothetical protein VEH57_08625 [Thermoplasmata archaeon]|nr:hypothetical protein [Thermoplasmata archaeon]
MSRRLSRRRFWDLVIAAAAGVVVVLIALVGLGILVLPARSSPSVTVDAVDWTILQGKTRLGIGWFGQSYVNLSNTDGLPYSVTSGGRFSVSLTLSNLDSFNHTIYSVTAQSPFQVASVSPTLPRMVPSGEDDWFMSVSVTAPSVSSDSSYILFLTVNAFD